MLRTAVFNIPWFQRFIFIIFIAKGRGKINLWNQGIFNTEVPLFYKGGGCRSTEFHIIIKELREYLQ
jgi:hypothetical protein